MVGFRTLSLKGPQRCGEADGRLQDLESQRLALVGHAEEQWLVLNVLGGGDAKRLAVQSRNNGRGYIPWTGVAAQIAKQEPGRNTETTPAVEGQAFTFLPLPVKTGLPVHVRLSLLCLCLRFSSERDGQTISNSDGAHQRHFQYIKGCLVTLPYE